MRKIYKLYGVFTEMALYIQITGKVKMDDTIWESYVVVVY
jgi:hypothetical protein